MIIAWDFDGVLNRNQTATGYVWEDDFLRDVGQTAKAFEAFVFADSSPKVIAGEIDILDRLQEWTATVDTKMTAQQILDYWLAADARPDAEMLTLVQDLQARGIQQVIASNNEARRAAYITQDMGIGAMVTRVFASGPMGVAKPDPAYYTHISTEMAARPDEMLMVDDKLANVTAAQRLGWKGYHFTPDTRAGFRAHLENLIAESK